MITRHPEARRWLPTPPGTSYAFRLDAGDVPRHVHRGRPLNLEQAVSVAADLPAEDPGGFGGTSRRHAYVECQVLPWTSEPVRLRRVPR